ncbi:DUF4012 domain-containing protein [uncultured Microbacterium sp.]|uniref:DUF4012 domain-containing protein n=1 Tax=uncultured Microbacterium sp. TaxID=191216 RepID=UPI0028E63386|nr:DUF4012 domain-containing protein [uncultured Microbacterium sp.]
MSNEHPPINRRQARAQRDAIATPVDGQDERSFLDELADPAPSPERHARRGAESRPKKKRWWIWALAVVILLGLLAAGAFVAKRVYDQAMAVRGHLELSMTEVREVQRAVLAGETGAATAAAARLSQHTDAAVAGTKGRAWSFAEAMPFVGDDLGAIRTVAEVTDQLATDVVGPASALSLASLLPKDGGLDLASVAQLSGVFSQMDAGIDDSIAAVAAIDQAALIPQVASGVKQLDDALLEAHSVIAPVTDLASVLPDALGASGPREYLLMLQGNSEARSLGGNAAVLVVVQADAGRLSVSKIVNSSDFPQGLPELVAPVDPEAIAIYGDKIGRYTPDLTMIPNFPEAASIMQQWWKQIDDSQFEGVMSIDPIALSYILGATGPIQLPTGDTLSAENAASLLLNEVYFRYDDIFEQNAFFGAAATSVFTAVTGGNLDVVPFITAVGRAAEEGRLLYTSSDPVQTELVGHSRFSGMMAADGADQTTIGVFVNDNTGSKKSYYLDMGISVCTSGSTVTSDVALTSSLTAEQAEDLPWYITGPYFDPSEISSFVAVYGPTNSSVGTATVDGAPANIVSQGNHLGRPVVLVEVLNTLADSHALQVTFDGVDPSYGPVSVWNTPMVRDTAVKVSPKCQ